MQRRQMESYMEILIGIAVVTWAVFVLVSIVTVPPRSAGIEPWRANPMPQKSGISPAPAGVEVRRAPPSKPLGIPSVAQRSMLIACGEDFT